MAKAPPEAAAERTWPARAGAGGAGADGRGFPRRRAGAHRAVRTSAPRCAVRARLEDVRACSSPGRADAGGLFGRGSPPVCTVGRPGVRYQNPHVRAGLTADGLRWALTTGDQANWHPVTWLSHMMDVQLFGLDAGRHHLTSLATHTPQRRAAAVPSPGANHRRISAQRVAWRRSLRFTRFTSSRSRGLPSGRTCSARSSGCSPRRRGSGARAPDAWPPRGGGRRSGARTDEQADARDAAIRPAPSGRVAPRTNLVSGRRARRAELRRASRAGADGIRLGPREGPALRPCCCLRRCHHPRPGSRRCGRLARRAAARRARRQRADVGR